MGSLASFSVVELPKAFFVLGLEPYADFIQLLGLPWGEFLQAIMSLIGFGKGRALGFLEVIVFALRDPSLALTHFLY